MHRSQWKKAIQDEAGNLILTGQVTVRFQATGAKATLYADDDGLSLKDNPFTYIDGEPEFFARGAMYSVRIRSGGFDKTYNYQAVGNAQAVDVEDLGIGANPDVQVDVLAGRDAYDSEAEGFVVLVSDVGDGKAAIYTRTTATPGVWTAPAYVTGPIGPTGRGLDFDAVADNIAERADFDDEAEGFAVLVIDSGDGRSAVYLMGPGGSADWGPPAYLTGDRYDLSLFVAGLPHSGEMVMRHTFSAAAVTFPEDLTASSANSEDPADASAEFSIRKNGVEIGTVTFAAASTTGVFAFPTTTNFVQGDIITVLGPVPQDATLFNVSITLSGTRTP